MRGARFKRAASSLAALATLIVLTSAQVTFKELSGFFGQNCTTTADCQFKDSLCDEVLKTCHCQPDVPVSNQHDRCGKAASINEACSFNEQCQEIDYLAQCKNGKCTCRAESEQKIGSDGNIVCVSSNGRIGDHCSTADDCLFKHSECHDIHKTCQCHPDMPISNYNDKCGKLASINETCMFNEQCEAAVFKTECRNERCTCKFEMIPKITADGGIVCTLGFDSIPVNYGLQYYTVIQSKSTTISKTPAKPGDYGKSLILRRRPMSSSGLLRAEDDEVKIDEGPHRTLDPAMIGVLVGMALMFVIICVVLRLFSRARWRENRTIFNTPNPRLMNVSLLRDSKLLHSQDKSDRRGSRVSVRAPSRQASQQELRPHSPSPARPHQSHQLHRKSSGSRRGSRTSSGQSATSLRSATLRSPITPGPTSVTVEIRGPDA